MTLQPCYTFGKPIESILLAKTKISTSAKGNVVEGNAEVRLNLLPKAGICVYASFPSHPLNPDLLTIAGGKLSGHAYQFKINPHNGNVKMVWHPKINLIIGRGNQNTQVAYVVFHIFNYRTPFGEKTAKGWRLIDHINLKADRWHVEIRDLQSTENIFDALKETGGYGLTHIGCLRREDGSNFDGKKAEEMLSALRFFLSFSKGLRCDPCLPVGFDDKGNRVWELWDSPWEQWATPLSWFYPYHWNQLVDLFPGFMAKWNDKKWNDALKIAIDWYVQSNHSKVNIKAGIILAQAGIERLSYEYAVTDKKLVTATGFDKLKPASEKFRLLFSSMGIPSDIPVSLSELQKFAKGHDAPHTITDIRNSFIHPKGKVGNITTEALIEAWNLGQWYLEVSLLKIFNYSGTYNNRILNKVETI